MTGHEKFHIDARARQVNPLTGTSRRMRSREVTGIDQSSKLNKALWTLAEKMAELKQVS